MLKNITPAVVDVDEPFIVHYFKIFAVASLMKRIVDVVAPAVLAFAIVRPFGAPDPSTLPSIVTLSAPFRSMSGPLTLPDIVTPDVVG